MVLLKISLELKIIFIKYLKENYDLDSDIHFPFKYFPEHVLVTKTLAKESGHFAGYRLELKFLNSFTPVAPKIVLTSLTLS